MNSNGHPTVLIIGGGFSGTMAAVHLLAAASTDFPLKIIVANRSGAMARGVAYGTRSDHHLLNVPAARMGAIPAGEGGFLAFAKTKLPDVREGDFLPRKLYGEYLEALLNTAIRTSNGGTLQHLVAEARAVQPQPDGTVKVTFTDGRVINANRLILALGNSSPLDLPVPDNGVYASDRYIRDPWVPGKAAQIRPDESVLLIGSGLTMVDVAVDLAADRKAVIYSVSRRGMLPQAHRALATPPTPDDLPPNLLENPTARNYLRSVRKHIAAATARGVDWRNVLNALRPFTPQLWQALPIAERRRLLRHARPFWDTHRHRVAPQPGRRIEQLLASRLLQIIPGRLVKFEPAPQGVRVTLRRRHTGEIVELTVSRVINCTGPADDLRRLADPLLTDLMQHNLIRPDPCGLGFCVDENYRLLDGSGLPAHSIFCVGPVLRALFWEATAVPELRVHAQKAAAMVVNSLR